MTIAGNPVTLSNTGNNYTATYTLIGGETEGVAAIAIDFSDMAGNNASQIVGTSDSTSVTIDTTAPIQSSVIVTPLNGSVSVKLNTHENATVILSHGFTNLYGSSADVTTVANTVHDKTVL